MVSCKSACAGLAAIVMCALLLSPAAGAGGRKTGCGACEAPQLSHGLTASPRAAAVTQVRSGSGGDPTVAILLGSGGVLGALAVGAEARRRRRGKGS